MLERLKIERLLAVEGADGGHRAQEFDRDARSRPHVAVLAQGFAATR